MGEGVRLVLQEHADYPSGRQLCAIPLADEWASGWIVRAIITRINNIPEWTDDAV
jgi:hypothetical protein